MRQHGTSGTAWCCRYQHDDNRRSCTTSRRARARRGRRRRRLRRGRRRMNPYFHADRVRASIQRSVIQYSARLVVVDGHRPSRGPSSHSIVALRRSGRRAPLLRYLSIPFIIPRFERAVLAFYLRCPPARMASRARIMQINAAPNGRTQSPLCVCVLHAISRS